MVDDVNVLGILDCLTFEPNRLKHIEGVVKLMSLLCVSESDCVKNDLLLVAKYHDIGYANELINSGFHPIDGFLHLKKLGFKESIQKAVLLHTDAKDLAPNELKNYYVNIELSAYDLKLLDFITYCDTHINDKGELCTLDERLSRIECRYGSEHNASLVFRSNISKYKSIEGYIHTNIANLFKLEGWCL